MVEKRCSKCGDVFVGACCVPCKRAYNAEYRSKHREEARLRSAAWHAANPDRSKAGQKAWRKNNINKIKASNAEYRAVNAEKIKEQKAVSYAANSETVKARVRAWSIDNRGKVKARMAEWARKNADYIRANNAKRYSANSEQERAKKRAAYAESPDVLKARTASWNAANPGKNAERAKAWRLVNVERSRDASRSWRKNNPDQRKIQFHNRRALIKNNGGKLSSGLSARLFILQKGLCACCKQPLGDSYHMDHIMPLALGGKNTDDNIQLLRSKCNSEKRSKHPIEFMQSRGLLL